MVHGALGGSEELLLVDSRASHNFISLKWCNIRCLTTRPSDSATVHLADGQTLRTLSVVDVPVRFGRITTMLSFQVLDRPGQLPEPLRDLGPVFGSGLLPVCLELFQAGLHGL